MLRALDTNHNNLEIVKQPREQGEWQTSMTGLMLIHTKLMFLGIVSKEG